MRLGNKVALITGAAAGLQGEIMGFGGATAWLFAREGARVVLTDIDEDMGRETASQIRDSGAEAVFIKLDVTKEGDWAEAVSSTTTEYGRINILFNSAGGGSAMPFEDMTPDDWDRVMDLNTKGVFLGTKHVVPEMRRAGGGSIINMSSVHGIVGTPMSIPYSAAKGAVRNFTKAAAVAYAEYGVRVNSIHPGNSLTARLKKLYPEGDYPERMWSRTPMQRLGTAEETAYAVLYLASDESSFTTGAELVVDGGFLAQ